MTEPEEFTMPLPPPFARRRDRDARPHDVIYIRGEGEADPGREHEDIMFRRVPRETAMHFRAGAGGRALTHAQYLAALVSLHARIRELADAGNTALATELETLGLQTVEV
jgi:hypothetical protein